MKFRGTILVSLILMIMSSMASAQTEVLYITDGDANDIKAIQNGVIIDQNLDVGANRRYRVAIRDTIWLGDMDQGTNAELDLALDPTGNSSPTGVDIQEGIDGATDGSSNYTVESFTGSADVYQFGPDWSGGVKLFAVSGNDIVGITFDSASGTLWISDRSSIYNYSMAGALLSSFPHSGGRGSLAYETTTDTLWYVTNSSDTLLQYSKGGQLLNSINVAYGGNVWGAEMTGNASVPVIAEPPEPVPTLNIPGLAVLILLLLSAGGLLARRKISV